MERTASTNDILMFWQRFIDPNKMYEVINIIQNKLKYETEIHKYCFKKIDLFYNYTSSQHENFEKFLSSTYILDCDVEKKLKIKDKEIATIIGLTLANEINTDAVNAFIEENKREKEMILNDLVYLTATSNVEYKM